MGAYFCSDESAYIVRFGLLVVASWVRMFLYVFG